MKLKRRKKKKRKPRFPHDRLEGDPPSSSQRWLKQVNKGLAPSDPGIPGGLGGMSAMPEATLAWLEMNCKFARMNDENPVKRTVIRDAGGEARET